ncbi:MAG: YedE family putative selenium transporter, partial [Oliverpabstia sp.]
NKGYTLKRSYRQPVVEGAVLPIIQVVMLALLVAAPAFILFSEEGAGPGAKHAAIAVSLIAGLIVGAIAQRTRLCMVGGIRDVVLFRETKLLLGFASIFVSALVCNLILTAATEGTYFTAGFAGQPVAHTDGLWNLLGMLLVGFACVLLGGCPLRQLILAGEGNSDSSVAVLGLMAGAAFAHNFGLASSGEGPTANGKIAVIVGIVIVAVIASVNTFKSEKA